MSQSNTFAKTLNGTPRETDVGFDNFLVIMRYSFLLSEILLFLIFYPEPRREPLLVRLPILLLQLSQLLLLLPLSTTHTTINLTTTTTVAVTINWRIPHVCRIRQCSGRPGFNPRSHHTKDFIKVFDTSLLNTQQYKIRIKGKEKGVAPSPTHHCSSYWKGSLRVALDYGHQITI